MFTSSFIYALIQIAIPALTAILSMSASKYLEKRDKILLASLTRIVSIAGLLFFYIIPRLDDMANVITDALDLKDLAYADTSRVLPVSHEVPIVKEVPIVSAGDQVPNVPQVPQIDVPNQTSGGKFHVNLPYIDYTPKIEHMDLQPLHKEVSDFTSRMMQPSIEQVNEIKNYTHLTFSENFQSFMKSGFEVLKDIIVR